jgi:hypothetical protein
MDHESREAEDIEGEFQSFSYNDDDGDKKDENSKAEEKKDKMTRNLSDADIEYLAKYLDPTYLKAEALAEIREKFEQESSIQLRGFL